MNEPMNKHKNGVFSFNVVTMKAGLVCVRINRRTYSPFDDQNRPLMSSNEFDQTHIFHNSPINLND